MNNIYNFFKQAWIDIKENQKETPFFLIILLFMLSIPLPLFVNNVLLGFLLICVFYYKSQLKFKFNKHLLLPIFLFIWMSLSLFWTIDKSRTTSAIPKELILFILPVIFLFIPKFTKKQINGLFKYYSYSVVLLVVVFLARAIIRFFIYNDGRAFFYHGEYDDDYGLVPKLLNAIHVSVYVALAFFYFFIKEIKFKSDYFFSLLLFSFTILLSSKNIIVIFMLLIFIQIIFYSKIANRMRLRNISIIIFILFLLFSFSNIKERFLVEFKTNTEKSISHNVTVNKVKGVDNVSIIQAWTNTTFTHNDYFPGTAFRVYQIRIFIELIEEEPIFWNGMGLNASLKKMLEKEKKYNLYPGYGRLNFHNQYVQNFAELGFIGFIILLIILFINTKNAFKSKDFMHIAFAVLMISLFLTESFLWRQRGVVFFTLFYCLFNSSSAKFNLEERK
jgi:O-antigen ligase